MREIPLKILVDAAWKAGFEEEDIWPFNYNGGWYHAHNCFAIVGDITEYGQFLLEVAQDPELGREYACALTRHTATDNMGRSIIFYFPGIKPYEEEATEDEQ